MNLIGLNTFNHILEEIKNKYSLVQDLTPFGLDYNKIINLFLTSKTYDNCYIHDCYIIANSSEKESFFGAIAIEYKSLEAKRTVIVTELQCFALKKIEGNFSNILIRPENLLDKIIDIFSHTDIDYPDFPEFSKKYLFLARNKVQGKLFATTNRLSLISKQNEILIEIQESLLFAKYLRNINREDCQQIIEFIKAV